MESFRDFFEQQEFVEHVLNEFNGVPSQAASTQAAVPQDQKPWSAKKAEIIQMWKSMRPDMPIIMTPISDNPNKGVEKSTYGEDGIRITGSWNFISAVLARLKEIVGYENPQSKLRLIFRGIDQSKQPRTDRQSYVFYVNLEKRSHGKAGRPKQQQNAITPII